MRWAVRQAVQGLIPSAGLRTAAARRAAEDGSEERRIPIIQTMVPREWKPVGG